MLKKQPWLNYADDLHVELMQSKDEGKCVDGFYERVESIKALSPEDTNRERLAADIYDEVEKLVVAEGYKYVEPSGYAEICLARPKTSALPPSKLNADELYDRIYGAWLGRCAGCLLGKPVEGWHRDRLVGLLKETDNYPVSFYISSDIPEELREKYDLTDYYPQRKGKRSWINNVSHMPEDDDTNYTVVGMKILERAGYDFTPDDVAETWLMDLPLLHLCTAERVAYKNLTNLIMPPASASYRNPYREWIGAQIRADFFGYISPGKPEQAAEMAWRDASISHIKNGIYGEMFVAGMLAAAYVCSDVREVITAGLSVIPERSRLYEAVLEVIKWHEQKLSWEEAIDKLHQLYDEKNSHDWCHTISNAMVVCIGLLFGELDLEKSIGIAVVSGLDTDCNGATVGSVVGLMLGASKLPNKWIEPLNDKLQSGVDGFGLVNISELARRTQDLCR